MIHGKTYLHKKGRIRRSIYRGRIVLKRFLLKFLVSLVLVTLVMPLVSAVPPTVLWSDEVLTNDVKLSKDGNYVAVASNNQLRFYDKSGGTPLWTYLLSSGKIYSVAISADGDCVVAGTELLDGGKILFWKNARTLTGTPDPTWMSVNLYGGVYRRCLDISDDGNYIVACGTGRWVFYWVNAKALSGNDKPVTWRSLEFPMVDCVDLSGDGDYVAAGIRDNVPEGYAVAYWKNARTISGNDRNPDWKSYSPDADVVDIAISDDGNYVAAATLLTLSVHYWANAKSLTGDPAHTWYYGNGVPFTCIDMSSDGGSVIAGGGGGFTDIVPQSDETLKAPSGVTVSGTVYFWSGARGLTGKPQNPTWSYTTDGGVHDVTIDDIGIYMAADGNIYVPGKVYFFNSGGTLLWSYLIDAADKLSISGDGSTLAVGTGAVDTGYLIGTGYSSGPSPVGGEVIPTSKLEILTPYLALIGLIIAVSTIVVVKKRRIN
jgi:hypothetical protein